MSGPVVARFGAGQTPKALASEPLAREVLDGTGRELWFAVPEEESEPGELADELGSRAAIVVTGGPTGPGPTVVDFSSRPAQIDRRGKLAILDLEQALGETTRLGPDMVFSVLVVCTGNSCRSPMAHVLLADLLTGAPAFVYSAGTGAPVGAPATAAAIEVMREPGLDLTRHRAQQLEPGMVRAADLILVMEALHRDYVVELVPEARGRTRLLLSYLGSDEEIDDPVGRPIEVYRRTLVRMRPALERVAAEIRQRTSGQPGSMKAEERRTKTVE
jgi:protein-tyrosine phosphatase